MKYLLKHKTEVIISSLKDKSIPAKRKKFGEIEMVKCQRVYKESDVKLKKLMVYCKISYYHKVKGLKCQSLTSDATVEGLP